jgi:hypothetical protein
MEFLPVIISSSSVGVVGLFILYYICKKCKQSECTAHVSDEQGNHIDISIGTPHVDKKQEIKAPDIV